MPKNDRLIKQWKRREGNNQVERLFSAVARYAYARPDLDKHQVAVLIALGSFVNAETRQAYPSTRTLAEMTRLSESTVQKAIRRLEAAEVIRNEGQRQTSRGMSTNLLTLLPRLDTDDEVSGGTQDHRSPSSSTYKKQEIGSVVPETTPSPEVNPPRGENGMWLKETSRKLSFLLSDELIARGIKNPDYRDDADSVDWLYRMEEFVSSRMGGIAAALESSDLSLVREVLVESVKIGSGSLDFRVCSAEYVPPRVLTAHPDEIVGLAVDRIRPAPVVAREERGGEVKAEDEEAVEANRLRMEEAVADSMRKHVVTGCEGSVRQREHRVRPARSREALPSMSVGEQQETRVFVEEVDKLLEEAE